MIKKKIFSIFPTCIKKCQLKSNKKKSKKKIEKWEIINKLKRTEIKK